MQESLSKVVGSTSLTVTKGYARSFEAGITFVWPRRSDRQSELDGGLPQDRRKMPIMSESKVNHLLSTDTLTIRDVLCSGACRHRSPDERASETQLVFPYRGIYVRHIGRDQAVADANHVLFFNAGENYQISHPVDGGDASAVLVPPGPY